MCLVPGIGSIFYVDTDRRTNPPLFSPVPQDSIAAVLMLLRSTPTHTLKSGPKPNPSQPNEMCLLSYDAAVCARPQHVRNPEEFGN